MGVKRGGMSSGNLCIEETKLRVLIRGEKKQKHKRVVSFFGGDNL